MFDRTSEGIYGLTAPENKDTNPIGEITKLFSPCLTAVKNGSRDEVPCGVWGKVPRAYIYRKERSIFVLLKLNKKIKYRPKCGVFYFF